jgi:adenylate cyclase, class 2
MAFLNVEIKARCPQPGQVKQLLQQAGANFRGTDYQTDTYFNAPNGRLKLREGNIENNLIFYTRNNQAGPKSSSFILTAVPDAASLKAALTAAMGVKVVVAKKRDISYIDNVKFHVDEVEGLGHFVEIEAGNMLLPEATRQQLEAQCSHYIQLLGIEPEHLLTHSYSDMLLAKTA